MRPSVRYKSFGQTSFADLQVYSKLPRHLFWSHVADKVDFTFADSLCSVLYTGRGQHPYAPSLKLKVHLIQAYYALPDRLVEEKITGDLFIKRFLDVPVDFFGFDHSTIGLDRKRMGFAMFYACHLYILAQMYSHGLWGDQGEQWIIDSFPAHVGLSDVGAERLIQQVMSKLTQHLNHHQSKLYVKLWSTIPLDTMTAPIPPKATTSDRLLRFSRLVTQAYGLLNWFGQESISSVKWDDPQAKAKSEELRALLRQVLEENSRPRDPHDPGTAPSPEEEATDHLDAAAPVSPEASSDIAQEGGFEKIPRKERSPDRIMSMVDPEVRVGRKNRFTLIQGYKIQNLCTDKGVILNVRVIPANEVDRKAMFDMTSEVSSFFGRKPVALLADSAYSHAKERIRLDQFGVPIIAPLVPQKNPTGLFDHSCFSYRAGKDVYECPNGKGTIRKTVNRAIEGTQYFFKSSDCRLCPLRSKCTKGKGGRSVFLSDYAEVYESAKHFNESLAGRVAQRQRPIVERKNQELKNDCGLGNPLSKSRTAIAIKSLLGAIVVNLKFTVRKLVAPDPGFVRRCAKA